MDRWIREHTAERYGPVRAVVPALVLEVAFHSVHRSNRHKSGVAMRRASEPCREADTLATLERLVT